MKLNNITLDERTERALRLCARLKELKDEIRSFVGEANCDLGGDGSQELREIASKGIIAATQQQMRDEFYLKS